MSEGRDELIVQHSRVIVQLMTLHQRSSWWTSSGTMKRCSSSWWWTAAHRLLPACFVAGWQMDNPSMQLRSLIVSSHVPWAKPELLHVFGTMKDCFTHPVMYAEYIQAIILVLQHSTTNFVIMNINERHHGDGHLSRSPYKTLTKLLYFTTREKY